MKINILLIEYNTETIEKIKAILRNKIFDINVACSEDVAKKLLEHRKFDLVITETLLPKSHGFILAKYISQKYPATKIIIISDKLKAAEHREEAIKSYGAADFLEKPLDDKRFRQAVLAILKVREEEILNYEDTADMTTNVHILPTLEELEAFRNKVSKEDIFGEIINEVKDNPKFQIDLD